MSTPDQTMRERVAVAMFARRDDPYDDREWAELDRADQEFWYCYADAALTALATPTPAMVEAVAQSQLAHDDAWNTAEGGAYLCDATGCDWMGGTIHDWNNHRAAIAYAASLTAAIKEGKA